MSEEMLIKHCSPTLAGLKTGNMFTCRYESRTDMNNALRLWNKTLSGKGIRLLPLRYNGKTALLYIYRPSKLERDLRDTTAREILNRQGYDDLEPEHCVVRLIKRMGEYGDFPHEIGLFLGYPPEDVSGFMENNAGGCKYAGLWKVYGDADAAKKTFAKFEKCTRVYSEQYAKGKRVERLTVAG